MWIFGIMFLAKYPAIRPFIFIQAQNGDTTGVQGVLYSIKDFEGA